MSIIKWLTSRTVWVSIEGRQDQYLIGRAVGPAASREWVCRCRNVSAIGWAHFRVGWISIWCASDYRLVMIRGSSQDRREATKNRWNNLITHLSQAYIRTTDTDEWIFWSSARDAEFTWTRSRLGKISLTEN